MPTQLLVSLSGIRSATLDDCAALSTELDARGVPISLLVTPRDPGEPAVLDWIRERRDRGDVIMTHGYDHTSDPIGSWGTYTVTRLGRRAEFAGLPAHEAGLRLYAANVLMERVGLSTDLFAPPRWLASSGTLGALRGRGYQVCAEGTLVRDLHSGEVYRGPVLGFAAIGMGGGERSEPWFRRALVLGVTGIARRGGLVRVAVDGAELARGGRKAALLDAVDAARQHGARPATYRTLAARTALAA